MRVWAALATGYSVKQVLSAAYGLASITQAPASQNAVLLVC